MVNGSAGTGAAAGSGSGAVPETSEASSPARKPASHARCVGVAGPTTRLRRSISSSAKGAVFGIGARGINVIQPGSIGQRRDDDHDHHGRGGQRRPDVETNPRAEST